MGQNCNPTWQKMLNMLEKKRKSNITYHSVAWNARETKTLFFALWLWNYNFCWHATTKYRFETLLKNYMYLINVCLFNVIQLILEPDILFFVVFRFFLFFIIFKRLIAPNHLCGNLNESCLILSDWHTVPDWDQFSLQYFLEILLFLHLIVAQCIIFAIFLMVWHFVLINNSLSELLSTNIH